MRHILIVGDYPPPYGGLSVQVAALRQRLAMRGDTDVRVLDIGTRRRERRPGCLPVHGPVDFATSVLVHARRGFIPHLHTNGHNPRSWIVTVGCTSAARVGGRRAIVSLGSGRMPAFLETASPTMRALARAALALAGAVIVRNERARAALEAFGVSPAKLVVLPGFYGVGPEELGDVPREVRDFRSAHEPLLGAIATRGPEYGLSLLVDAAARLRPRYPRLGVLLLGPDELADGCPCWVLPVGEQERPALLATMQALDVFVRPTYFDGDASSVREALALGVRVVASDTDFRPEGVWRFPPGDADALAATIDRALAGRPTRGESTSLPALLALYDSLGHDGTPSAASRTAVPDAPGVTPRGESDLASASGWRHKMRRLARMSPRELRHRVAVGARQRLYGLPWVAAWANPDDVWVARIAGDVTLRAGLPAALARGLGTRIYGEGWSPSMLAQNLAVAGAAERIVAEADRIRAHRVRVLAYGELDLGQPIDWHRDPLTGGQWPRHYNARTARGEARGLDPKVVWEPNRHQHLQTLAAAAVLTRDAGYADEVAEHLTSWIEQNAPGVGIHWVESTEPAARLLAWLWALPLVLDSPRFTPEVCLRVLRSMVAQARHIAANLSLYSSPNTHLLLEALALFVVGTVLPELSAASAWRTRGREILEREIEVQVGDDGFYREASTYYHAYAVEFYILASVIAERNGELLAPVVATRLQRMLEALAWLTRPDGTLPNIGDADGGRTLRLGAPALVRVTELLAAGAVLTGRAELRAGLLASGEEAAWLWPDALERLERLGPAAPPRGGRQFPDARLAVERRDVNGDERWTLFDGGDLGMLAGGHGHAGCLGLGLYANGRALIVDRGTYVYNAAPAWRRYFRGTRAHSTVVVDGVEQAEPGAGNFQWAIRYGSRLVRHLTTAEYTLVTGEHDGYRRLAAPVRHRRSLLSVAGEYWLCIDTLIGTGAHSVEFLFQLAPGLEAQTVGDAVFAAAADAGAGLLIAPAGFDDARIRVMTGATEPLQGWHSDDYGDRRPAPTVVTTAVVQLPAVWAHVLAPCARAPHASPVVESRRVDAGLSITVRTADTTDLVLCSADEPRLLAAHGVAFVGELLHARLDNAGTLRRFLAVQARSVAWRGDALVGTGESADWVVRDADQVFGRG